ncbi:permease [Clostridium sp. DL1XJH146]
MKIVNLFKKNILLAFVILIYIVLFIFAQDKAISSVDNSMYYVIEMLQIMPVIFLLTAILDAWVPKDAIVKNLGKDSGTKGILLSFVFGSISAGPIYAAFLVCKMLLNKGASVKNIVVILSAWAVIKVPMLANEAKFLGVHFMSIRWILTVISIVIIAYLVSLIVKREDVKIEEVKELSEVKKISILTEACMGCGLCAKSMPEYFQINNRKAEVTNKVLKVEDLDKLKEVSEKCPAKVIRLD